MTTPIADRFARWTEAIPESGCLIWMGAITPRGYGEITLGGRAQRAHRIAYQIAHGPIPPGMQVLHRCDVRCCVAPGHLFLGKEIDNVRDMIEKGRRASTAGARNGAAKLTDDQVRAIRSDLRAQTAVAEAFGIHQSLVSLIRARKRWAHVEDVS
ncbi:HNH endonuclease signature motif containing protein [Burkholderia sp. BE12]|uniref:HNH endonuclease signature motif containing protein n=1 Tax=Burkholderia sp. BE12 TaxID=2082394 RepID=UPI000CF476AF|nr:HNH endonuclease signature motif containing protein [Burkholderia sp. BE12]